MPLFVCPFKGLWVATVRKCCDTRCVGLGLHNRTEGVGQTREIITKFRLNLGKTSERLGRSLGVGAHLTGAL